MSTFVQRDFVCRDCGHGERLEVVQSLNGGRRGDLRQQILEGRFQWHRCPGCGRSGVIEVPFVYIDFGRKQWVSCFTPERERDWRRLESEPLTDWKEAMITHASPVARRMSEGFVVRAVFGQAALREKLLAWEHGLDDHWLAVLVLDLMRAVPALGFHPDLRPRLVGVGEGLRFASPRGELELPRARLDELRLDPLSWNAAWEAVGGGPYVDVGRLMFAR